MWYTDMQQSGLHSTFQASPDYSVKLTFQKTQPRELASWVQVPVIKPDDLGMTLTTHMV